MAGKSLILLAFLGLSIPPMGTALAQATSAHPDGAGNPDATTCRPPQPIPNSRFSGPRVCKLNSQWALLRKNGEDISADGLDIIPDAKAGGMAPMNCTMAGDGATSAGRMDCRTQ